MPARTLHYIRELYAFIAALLMSLAATTLCRISAGVSLGLFFGGVAIATLIVPPMVAGETGPLKRWLVPLGTFLGVTLVWVIAIGDSLTFSQCARCCVALIAYVAVLCAVTTLLLALRVNAVLASGVVTLLALLWLTWPVWLSSQLRGPRGDTLVGWLVPAHPLFAINGVLGHFDTWDRYPIAYAQLTVLNQDVFYTLPEGVTWTLVVSALIAVAAGAAGSWVEHRREA